MTWLEQKFKKWVGIPEKENIQEWVVTREVARKHLLKIADHFEENKILTQQQFEVMAEQCNKEVEEGVNNLRKNAKQELKKRM